MKTSIVLMKRFCYLLLLLLKDFFNFITMLIMQYVM